MEWKDLVASLGRFGLSEREATMYLSLLQRGRATARELSREARVDRVLGYRLLDGLVSRGVVEVTAERPRRYAPVPPSALLNRSLRERQLSLESDVHLAKTLEESLPELAKPAEDEAPRFQVLTGETLTYEYLRDMLGRAEREISVMITHRALRRSVNFGLASRLPGFLERGGRFRILVESDLRIRHLLGRFLTFSSRFPRAEVRQLHPQPVRLTLVDRREALLFLVPESRARTVEEVAVWTNAPEFVQAQLLYFDRTWEMGGSPSLASGERPEVARGRRRRPA